LAVPLRTLSRKCKYALQALYRLTPEYAGGGLVSVATIAREEGIPRKFLEAILSQARLAGLVDSRHGKAGGYYLALPPGAITIGSVIRAIDGPLAPLPCVSETAYRRCPECADESRCRTRFVMKKVRDAIADVLDGITLLDLAALAEPERTATITASFDI
jgi:Rrf2 family protein